MSKCKACGKYVAPVEDFLFRDRCLPCLYKYVCRLEEACSAALADDSSAGLTNLTPGTVKMLEAVFTKGGGT